MKNTVLIFVIALSLASYLVSSPVYGDDTESSRKTLRGITSVDVMINLLEPEIEKTGVTVSQLMTNVEAKLKMTGMKILKTDRWLNELGSPYLYINIDILKIRHGVYVNNVQLELMQEVVLVRNQISKMCSTWSLSSLGISYNANDIREDVKGLLDHFLNAWLSVNPK